jgi:hypothetical protein
MPHYVSASAVTPDEPSSGWYYVKTDEDGNETIVGPFLSKHDALDDESGGAYSEYLADKRALDRDETYREGMINAGRGRLLRDCD